MSSYPDNIDTFREVEDYPGTIIDPTKKDTVYAQDTIDLQEAIVAVETTIGTDPAASYGDIAARLTAIEAYMEGLQADYTALDNYVATLKLPVGSLYYNADSSTNPATLLGYGTWVAFGAGRVIVGKATSGTFATNGATGGAETVALTTGQLPAFAFGFGHHGDENGSIVRNPGVSGGAFSGTLKSTQYKAPPGTSGGAASWMQPTWSFGNNEAHNNLPPYIVVYAWKRTA